MIDDSISTVEYRVKRSSTLCTIAWLTKTRIERDWWDTYGRLPTDREMSIALDEYVMRAARHLTRAMP